jgi:hypothetical protein
MSSRPLVQATAAGALLKTPPSPSHPPHFDPSHHWWYIWLSVPIAKMSSRLESQETATGGLVLIPPSPSQPVGDGPHFDPSHHLWNNSLLVPSPKTSSRLEAHETTAGRLLKVPPSGSQSVGEGPHLDPSHHVEHLVVGPKPKDIEPVEAPRGHGWRAGKDSTEWLPARG